MQFQLILFPQGTTQVTLDSSVTFTYLETTYQKILTAVRHFTVLLFDNLSTNSLFFSHRIWLGISLRLFSFFIFSQMLVTSDIQQQ